MKWLWAFLIILISSLNSCTKPNTRPNIDIYGHAGASLHSDRTIYPANSLESIQYALNVLDADGVEVDIQMTKDSVLVLYHNPYIGQTSNINNCMSFYDYNEIKNLKIDYTTYKIAKLEEVLKIVQNSNKQLFLDIKFYDFCKDNIIELSTFQYALNKALNQIDTSFVKTKIMIGLNNYTLLSQIDFPNKCYEATDVESAIAIANNYNFNALLFFDDIMSEQNAQLLNNSNLFWGIIGVKSKWEIDRVVNYHPKFIISDNIARTKKVTN
ncbi:MAG TPA: hypothetical protein EYG85_00905 [Crocinitomix sp.]|nr:hypothetical protein [Crocinitomix sp.]